jgi:hypothetical protein
VSGCAWRWLPPPVGFVTLLLRLLLGLHGVGVLLHLRPHLLHLQADLLPLFLDLLRLHCYDPEPKVKSNPNLLFVLVEATLSVW